MVINARAGDTKNPLLTKFAEGDGKLWVDFGLFSGATSGQCKQRKAGQNKAGWFGNS